MTEDQRRRRAASDPVRLRIIERLGAGDQWTAKQLARELGVGANGLYYHLRVLEEAGLIKVVGTKATGRMVERVYGKAEDQRVTWDMHEPLELAIHLGAILEGAKARAEEAIFDLARRAEAGELQPGFLTFNAPSFETSREEIAAFGKQVWELQQEFRQRAADLREQAGAIPSDWKRMRFTYVLHDEAIRNAGAGEPTTSAPAAEPLSAVQRENEAN